MVAEARYVRPWGYDFRDHPFDDVGMSAGVFDSKPDLSAFQSSSIHGVSGNAGVEQPVDSLPKLKLGLAPLSSELAFSGLGHTSGGP